MQELMSMMKDNIGGLDTMNFDQFVETLRNEVKQLVGAEYSVSVNCVMKVNRELQGLNIRHKNSVVSPSIYLEDYYQEYQRGKNIEKIAEEVIEISKYRKLNVEAFTDNIKNYEWVKVKLRVKLMNFEKNKNMLQTVPYERMLDLAIVPYIILSKGEELMSVTVSGKLLDCWGISEKEILKQAKQNTLAFEPVVVERMTDFISNMFLKDLNDDSDSDDEQTSMIKSEFNKNSEIKELYILTNQDNRYGAFAALQHEQLLNIAERLGADNLYILPSSVHEILVISSDNIKAEQLREMVREVNRTTVSEEEFLSDEVYLFDSNKVSLII